MLLAEDRSVEKQDDIKEILKLLRENNKQLKQIDEKLRKIVFNTSGR